MGQVTRLFEYIYQQQATHPLDRAFAFRHNGKEISVYSTAQTIELANKTSRGLLRLGLKKGDMVSTVVVKNRPEWTILDIALLQIGVINVPVYPTISSREYEYIFNEADVKMCFIGDDTEGSVFKKINAIINTTPSLSAIYTFDKTASTRHWEEIWDNTEGRQSAVEAIKNSIQTDDMATIIYTSGTTGNPKGVMLSHKNIISNIEAVAQIFPVMNGERVLSFLPLNHIFERVGNYFYQRNCAEVIYTGIDNLGGDEGDLKAVKPHFFATVPRLLEKVYEKIYNKGLDLKGAKRAIFFWALKQADAYSYDKEYSGIAKIKFGIANKLIFSKWREALGGELKGIVVGASPCPVKIARVFSAAGIPIREGYGMTELSPAASVNRFDKGGSLLGSVGPVIAETEVKIDTSDGNYQPEEGEIIVTGPGVMLGYYKNDAETAKVVKIEDGKHWIMTGDIGKFVTVNGVQFLKITDRKKELFKTTGGKYVAPAPIENKLRENFLVEQVMVIGDNQKFVSAIITPATDALKSWCTENNIAWTSLSEVLNNDVVVKKYKEIIDRYNPNFSHVEQVKAFRLVPDAWEAIKTDGSNSELTPTMKLKRRVLVEKYKKVIEEIYG